MCLSCGAATFVQVLQDHAEEFLEKMNSKVLAPRLKALELIPQTVENKVLQSMNRTDANAHLLSHLKTDADVKVVSEVFRVAFQATEYRNMSAFAEKMLRTLQQGLYWCMHTQMPLLCTSSLGHACVYVNKSMVNINIHYHMYLKWLSGNHLPNAHAIQSDFLDADFKEQFTTASVLARHIRGKNLRKGDSVHCFCVCVAYRIFDDHCVSIACVFSRYLAVFIKRLTVAARFFKEGTCPASFNSNRIDIATAWLRGRTTAIFVCWHVHYFSWGKAITTVNNRCTVSTFKCADSSMILQCIMCKYRPMVM